MRLKRLAAVLAVLVLAAVGAAPVAQAQLKKFALTGGGGQLHIGNGLMLPIQQAASPATNMGLQFPNLRVPALGAQPLSGTTAKPLLSAPGGTVAGGTKFGYQRQLNVPPGALRKFASQTTVGVRFSNTTLHAVGSKVNYSWPIAPVVLTTAASVHPSLANPTVSQFGGTMVYSNALGQRFGGPGSFRLSPPAVGAGLVPAIAVTVFAKAAAQEAPCLHPAFGGTQTGCIAALVAGAAGTADLGIGRATPGTTLIPAAPVSQPVIAILGLGGSSLGGVGPPPWGTILTAGGMSAMAGTGPRLWARAAPGPVLLNTAMSKGGPWTTGRINITNTAAVPMTETFTLTGKDARTANGGGTIQLVSGSVSTRATTGPNSNRGWVELQLIPAEAVPATQWWGLAAIAALIALSFGYAMRQRLFARG